MRWGVKGGRGSACREGRNASRAAFRVGGRYATIPVFLRPGRRRRDRSVSVPPLASHITVLVFPSFKRRVTQKRLRRVVEAALDAAAASERGEVSLVIADDEALLELNARHRGEASVTDVLSFSPHHAGPYMGDVDAPDDSGFPDFPTPDGQPEELGEVVISYPQAKRQARQALRPVAVEVETLVVHGVLHLLGYDHAEPDEEREMFALQDAALALAGAETAR